MRVVLTADGYRKVQSRLADLGGDTVVYTVPEFAEIETPARVRVLDPAALPGRVGKSDLAMVILAAVLEETGIIPIAALQSTAAEGPFGDNNLAAIDQGMQLAAL